jgi:hypothetical protein
MNSAKLLLRHQGRDAASVNAYLDAAKGHWQTWTFIDTENGKAICGSYLDPARVEGGYTEDHAKRGFLFTLKNYLGIVPTKFRLVSSQNASQASRNNYVILSGGTWVVHICPSDPGTALGPYENAAGHGVATFSRGNRAFGAGRWELWETT